MNDGSTSLPVARAHAVGACSTLRGGRMHSQLRLLSVVSIVLAQLPLAMAACKSKPGPTQTSASESPAKSATPDYALFADGPVELRSLRVDLGRAGAARDLDVRGELKVTAPEKGTVELPLRVACVFGAERVVTTSSLIFPGGKSFSLKQAARFEVYAQAPTHIGWLGKPTACELELRLEGTGKSKGKHNASERVCWSDGAVRPGPCNWTEPTPPRDAYRLYGLEVDRDGSELGVHAHLQVRGADETASSLQVEATCGAADPTRSSALLSVRPFAMRPGDSVPVSLKVARNGPLPCTLSFLHANWDSDKETMANPFALGSWCTSSDPDEVAPKQGACR